MERFNYYFFHSVNIACHNATPPDCPNIESDTPEAGPDP